MYLVTVRYGTMLLQENVLAENAELRKHERVVAQTSRGTEYAQVVSAPLALAEGAPVPQAGRILRRATKEDLALQHELEGPARWEAEKACMAFIEQHKLPMRLVCAEHLLGKEKVFFYFVSDTRVDFRNLVRDLARHFQTRIELRQIGEREEARLLGDQQSCGQQLCCQAFLRRLDPIPMSLARIQKQSLDPSKISGQCGKLKCCLRFEEQVYAEMRRRIPNRGTLVATETVHGVVSATDVYNQRVTIETSEGARVTVSVADLKSLGEGGVPAVTQEPDENDEETAAAFEPGERVASTPAQVLEPTPVAAPSGEPEAVPSGGTPADGAAPPQANAAPRPSTPPPPGRTDRLPPGGNRPPSGRPQGGGGGGGGGSGRPPSQRQPQGGGGRPQNQNHQGHPSRRERGRGQPPNGGQGSNPRGPNPRRNEQEGRRGGNRPPPAGGGSAPLPSSPPPPPPAAPAPPAGPSAPENGAP